MSDTFEINACEVCGTSKLVPVLNLGSHPMCDDLVPVGDQRVCQEYPIEILFCETCATAHQRFQVPKRTLFPATYHYRARFTADVLNGMSKLVDACEERYGSLQGKKVLDIGCNDGSLLNFFAAKGCLTFGIEPTGAALDAKKNGHVVYNTFLSEETARTFLQEQGKPDIITFTNVFAHIENLPEVVNALKVLASPNLMLVIENHYLGSVLAHSQFDTFYHEHPRTYSYSSFLHIAKSIGLALQDVEFPARYGGNIRVFMGHSSAPRHAENHQHILAEEQCYLEKFAELRTKIQEWKASKGELLEKIKKDNRKIRGKAFPGRAAILIKMLGIDESVISAVFEKPGSMKIGHYVPGTRIPILSDDELFADNEKAEDIMNFSWHISSEIKSYLSANGYQGKVIDVLNAEDFQR